MEGSTEGVKKGWNAGKDIKYGMVKYEMLFDKLICIQLAIKTVGQKHLFNILNRISRYEKSELQLK